MTTNVKTLIKNENKVGIVVANNINEKSQTRCYYRHLFIDECENPP